MLSIRQYLHDSLIMGLLAFAGFGVLSCNAVTIERHISVTVTPVLQAHSGNVVQTPKELTIVPATENKPDDIAQLLDVKPYRFDVTLPKAEATLWCYVEIHRRGKPTISWGEGPKIGPSEPTRYQVLVVMEPLGKDWNEADKVKFVTRITPLDGTTGGGDTMTSVQDNPFRHNRAFVSGTPELQKDGRWLLAAARMTTRQESPTLSAQDYDTAVFIRMYTTR